MYVSDKSTVSTQLFQTSHVQMRKLSLCVGELLAQDQTVRSGRVKFSVWRTYPFLRKVSIAKVNENVSFEVKTALEQKAVCWSPA